MNPKTRQTLIGVSGLVLVQTMAMTEGFNGRVTLAALAGIISIVSGHWWDDLSFNVRKEE